MFKKSLLFSVLSAFITLNASAQMVDLMGSMAVGGAQTTQSVKSVGQMNKTMRINQFMNQLQMQIADITTTYFGLYQNMQISSMQADNVKVVFRPVRQGQYYEAFISPMNQALCNRLISASFDNLVEYRVVAGGSSTVYKPSIAREQRDGICVTASSIALILQ